MSSKNGDSFLQDRDILQVDPTMIAGALVLLTICSLSGSGTTGKELLFILTAFIVVPFSWSAVILIFTYIKPEKYSFGPKELHEFKKYSLNSMFVGLLYTTIAIVFLMLSNTRRMKYQNMVGASKCILL